MHQTHMLLCAPKVFFLLVATTLALRCYLAGGHRFKIGGVWKLNPRDRSITLTKLLIKHAKFTQTETEFGA